jgi:hypothetical protein
MSPFFEGLYFKSLFLHNKLKLFVILAEHQITCDDEGEDDNDDASENTSRGLSYNSLYQKALDDFLVPNETVFKTLLTEFKDHQVFVMTSAASKKKKKGKKKATGENILSIPLDNESLAVILDGLNM